VVSESGDSIPADILLLDGKVDDDDDDLIDSSEVLKVTVTL